MAHFQESRFFGLSGRTLVVTIVIGLVVVGFFFLPPMIKHALQSSGKVGDKRASLEKGSRREGKQGDASARGALSPDILKAINSSVEGTPTPKAAPPAARKDNDDGERQGLFSGWDFKVKAGEPNGAVVRVPASMSLDKIGGKEFQGLLKQSQGDVRQFIKKRLSKNAEAESIVLTFMDQMELAARERAKGMSDKEILAGLQELHVSTIQALSRAGLDRGAILEWLKLPIVSFIDDRVGLHAQEKVRDYFVPRLTLRAVNVRQRRSDGWGMDGRSPATLRVELGFQGSDIEKIVVFANGRKISQAAGPRSSDDDHRSIRVSGDAHGVWTFVAYDRFGGRPYWKSYSFYPRVTRFRQNRNGEYMVAFRPNSAPNSLDRFFLVGSSVLSQNSDSMVSKF